MKTDNELNELKEKVENLNEELKQLDDEELAQVAGGFDWLHFKAVDPKIM